MDLITVAGTCVSIMLAELGDKTQLAVFGATAATRKPVEVFVGATAGLAAVTLVGVLLGHYAGSVIPPRALRLIGGLLFVGIGLSLLIRRG